MAKLSSSCKYDGTLSLGFSESEIDVARQLIRLCCNNDGNIDENGVVSGKRRRVPGDGFDGINRANSAAMVIEDNDDDLHLKPRKRKSKSIHYIYSSTKPIVVFNAKKICCS
ncbi:hypothetical protein CCACVL1_29596 [Corchorus capsularis]|uniref:Uncharacterized protein n=1 Tax=Corchorus capsularis TaxID=210143 RepID=A0A1R3G108_COCAP|nr:hypothetical protein CCACVL1_29596 [Corchorus capsularis]